MQRSLVYGDQVCFKHLFIKMQIFELYKQHFYKPANITTITHPRWHNCWMPVQYGKTMSSRSTTSSSTTRNLLLLHRWLVYAGACVIFISFRAPRLDILPWASRPFQVYLRRLKITRTTVKVSWAEIILTLKWRNLSTESLVWTLSVCDVLCLYNDAQVMIL